ncbi:MAG: hypothetical protein JSR91_05215 [Proteobacteria bacterium]|nr:hypothetical protein [Pseudomonadota bacterium]
MQIKEIVLTVALTALIGGCAYRHETVVERPAPAPQPARVVVADPPPPPGTVVVTDPPPRTVYVPSR